MKTKNVLYYTFRIHNYFWIILFFIFPKICLAQNLATISGYVYHSQTRESLIGVNIITEGFGVTTTNSYGYYSLTLRNSEYNLEYSYLGFSTKTLNFDLKRDTVINIYLHSSKKEIDEVVVTTKSSSRRTNEFAAIYLTPLSISKLPMVFGENDPIKAIQIQTGVKTVGDGTSGFYAQGGNIDQNLILIDEAPIYNPSHLFGLVSVFNPDAVKSVKFLTGNMSAKYGGRLSSVMEVTMNEGNMNSYQVSGGLNILSSRLTLQGPIISDKASFFIGLRRSFVDLLVGPSSGMSVVPQFYDINLKTNYKIGHKNRIYVLNDIILFQNIGVNYGIRLTAFQSIGNSTWYDYDENFVPFNENRNEKGIYNSYVNIEPRVTVKYFATENITLQTSYAKTSQYVQLLQNNSYGYTSLETWIPASPNVAPQTANIYSLGIEVLKRQEYNFSLNSYYKKLANQIEYIDHARLIGVRHIETQIKVGEGEAYGIEVNASKTSGRITGNISYNFS